MTIDVTDDGIQADEVTLVIQHSGEMLIIIKMEGVKDGRVEDALQYSGMKVVEVIRDFD